MNDSQKNIGLPEAAPRDEPLTDAHVHLNSPRDPALRLGDFSMTARVLPIAALAIGIGIVSAFSARLLLALIGLFTNALYFGRFETEMVSPAAHSLGAWSVLIPVAGGLLIGIMARYGSERIRGHGIPEALESILIGGSRVQARLAVLKPVSAAISIGSGGPFGAEGPIIMTGGALGSLISQTFHLTSAERKTLLVAGAAGGMTAVFGSPLAAMLLAVELLLFEWKPRSFLPVALSCAAAMATRQFLLEPGPLFQVPAHAADISLSVLAGCVFAGLAAGALATALTHSVYLFEDLFQKRLRRIHWMWWPTLAGLVIGLGGLLSPRALGVGFDSIGDMIQGRLAWQAVLVLMLVKWGIWSFALGSGTSGGVLAPLLMLGAGLGVLENSFLPAMGVGFWPLVSMGAILGGCLRSPFTGILFALEITHDWDALLPLVVAVTVAHAFSVLALRRSILTEKVERRGFHVSREYAIDPLEVLFVREVMRAEAASTSTPVPVPGTSTYPDETLRSAVYRMASAGVSQLPVISRIDDQVLGEVTLLDLLGARRRHLEEETRRQRPLALELLIPRWQRAKS